MFRRSRACAFAVMALALLTTCVFAQGKTSTTIATATGVVFDDTNSNGRLDVGEKGIGGVRVSNGREIVRTDGAGRYRLPAPDGCILFVTKPSGWMTPVSADNLPRFFYIHNPSGSPKLRYPGIAPTGPLPASVDFPLHRRNESKRFTAIFCGDTQPSSVEQVRYLEHGLLEELVGSDAAFGITLGDYVFNDMSLYDELVPAMGSTGMTWYNVKGNHDSNYDAAADPLAIAETFKRVFGPSYYSYDYGGVHFVALANPYFGQGNSNYSAQLDADQMEWLKNDLALLPKKQLVVLTMHIPILEMQDRNEIYKLLEDHPNRFCVAAHWHQQETFLLSEADGWKGKEPLYCLVNGTTCGCWLRGMPDDVGVPMGMMSDGTPRGYSVISFNGSKYSVRYKVIRRPESYQMNIFAPDAVKRADLSKSEVLVNVFAGSKRSKVEMKVGEGGAWTEMTLAAVPDPYYAMQKRVEEGPYPPRWTKLPGASLSSHIWRGAFPADAAPGLQLITVRTTDMFGQTFTASRMVKID